MHRTAPLNSQPLAVEETVDLLWSRRSLASLQGGRRMDCLPIGLIKLNGELQQHFAQTD